MPLTAKKRRQIVQAVLPLLVLVWALMPGLPCCQAVAANAQHASELRAAHTTHGRVHLAHDSPQLAIEDALSSDMGIDSSTDAPLGTSDDDSADAPCADVDKNRTDVRSVASIDFVPVVLVFVVAVPNAYPGLVRPSHSPPPPLLRRPLHLSKSVLLI